MFKHPLNYISFVVGLIFFAVSCITLSFAEPVNFSPSHCITPDEQYGFAEHYYSNGDYDRAIDEYQRFIYFFPKDTRVETAQYQIGKSYYGAGKYEKAKNTFVELVNIYQNTDLAVKAYFDISLCYDAN